MNLELELVAKFLTGNSAGVSDVPWHALRREDVLVIREWLAETQPLSVQRQALGVLTCAIARIPSEGMDDQAPPQIGRLRWLRRRSGPGRQLSRKQAQLLFDVCRDDPTTAGARDLAVIALMLLAGLRRQEIVALERSSYEDDQGCLRVRSARAPMRLVSLEGECQEYLEAWLYLRGHAPGPMFLSMTSAELQGLAPSSVNRLLARRCRQAGGISLTPSELRSGFLRRLRSPATAFDAPRCRYYQTEEGKAAWMVAALAIA